MCILKVVYITSQFRLFEQINSSTSSSIDDTEVTKSCRCACNDGVIILLYFVSAELKTVLNCIVNSTVLK